MKPYSSSCERNSAPILNVLKQVIGDKHKTLLEVGSGTGQHAVSLASEFPHLLWTCSDVKSNHEGIGLWLKESNISNIKGPLEFEIDKDDFPIGDFDLIFTANTFHIIGWKKVEIFMQLCGENLKKNALVIIYGPFNYNGKYTSQSNADFDVWLKELNPLSTICSFEDVSENMLLNGFTLLNDFEMPANNRTLVFVKI
jgi:cyclopropane fatty-acyl-phospholipid synthase-like methyltransferase